MSIYILCPSKVSVTFSALSASIIEISSFIPVQNASLIAEIPFNWTVANTRYGIISVLNPLTQGEKDNVAVESARCCQTNHSSHLPYIHGVCKETQDLLFGNSKPYN